MLVIIGDEAQTAPIIHYFIYDKIGPFGPRFVFGRFRVYSE
jgi:hypothetical protein